MPGVYVSSDHDVDMDTELIDRAVDDLNEALLAASDGTVRVDEETLRRAVGLLLNGTDSGEFFDGFRTLFWGRLA